MKRLTDKRLATPPGQWQEVTPEDARELKEIPVPPMRELYYRLSLYEDTGLESEDIHNQLESMLDAVALYFEITPDRLRELAEAALAKIATDCD